MGFLTDNLLREARCADLIMMQASSRWESIYREINVGASILGAGRPVLVVPSGAKPIKATHVVIGWKDTREARRAVVDALPFLHEAERVTVLQLDEREKGFEARFVHQQSLRPEARAIRALVLRLWTAEKNAVTRDQWRKAYKRATIDTDVTSDAAFRLSRSRSCRVRTDGFETEVATSVGDAVCEARVAKPWEGPHACGWVCGWGADRAEDVVAELLRRNKPILMMWTPPRRPAAMMLIGSPQRDEERLQ